MDFLKRVWHLKVLKKWLGSRQKLHWCVLCVYSQGNRIDVCMGAHRKAEKLYKTSRRFLFRERKIKEPLNRFFCTLSQWILTNSHQIHPHPPLSGNAAIRITCSHTIKTQQESWESWVCPNFLVCPFSLFSCGVKWRKSSIWASFLKQKVFILCLLFCVTVTKASLLIAGMIRRFQRYLNPARSMSKLMSLFTSQNQTGVACVRIRYLQFNPDDGFIMENYPSPYHPERQPPRDEVPRAPVPPQLKLQALKAELKDVELLQGTGLTVCEYHVLVRIAKGLRENWMFVYLRCSAQLQSWKMLWKETFPFLKYQEGIPKTIAGKCRRDLRDLYTEMLDDSYQMGEGHERRVKWWYKAQNCKYQ